ncbi:MAG: Uma2 family endonuclease, partial [Selenomonadaceae bacterium]|nr:Uma2 family endonuclease [Selenomonadaceae bacterium]
MDEDYYEIIDGKRFRLPSMTLAQNQMQGRIGRSLMEHLMKHKSGYAFFNVDVYFDDKNILVPDIVVVLKEHEQILAQGDMIRGVPDMVVEVLSKSTKKKDTAIKKDLYEFNGMREYWIVDPWAKSIAVYLLRDGKY